MDKLIIGDLVYYELKRPSKKTKKVVALINDIQISKTGSIDGKTYLITWLELGNDFDAFAWVKRQDIEFCRHYETKE